MMSANGPSRSTREAVFRSAKAEADAARQRADYLTVRAWNIGLDQGVISVQPSPTIAQAIKGGFPFLRVVCNGCRQRKLITLAEVRRPGRTFVWQLEGMLACTHCRLGRVRAPRAVIDRLTASDVRHGWTEPPEGLVALAT
jgi:hypothetical protein